MAIKEFGLPPKVYAKALWKEEKTQGWLSKSSRLQQKSFYGAL